jgi:hypothetical protein
LGPPVNGRKPVTSPPLGYERGFAPIQIGVEDYPDWLGAAIRRAEILLQDYLKPLGLRQVQAAERLGISHNRLNENRCTCFVPDTQVLSGFGDLRASNREWLCRTASRTPSMVTQHSPLTRERIFESGSMRLRMIATKIRTRQRSGMNPAC